MVMMLMMAEIGRDELFGRSILNYSTLCKAGGDGPDHCSVPATGRLAMRKHMHSRDGVPLLIQQCAAFVFRASGLENNIKNIVGAAVADVYRIGCYTGVCHIWPLTERKEIDRGDNMSLSYDKVF